MRQKTLPLLAGLVLGLSSMSSVQAEDCEVGSPSVFKLEPSNALKAMMPTLVGPTDLITSPSGLSVVVVAIPLPCEERLTRVSVRVWDGYVVQQRGRGKRFLRALATGVRNNRLPWLTEFMPPPDQSHRLLRLERSARLGKGMSWVGNFNDHGVVMFPVACNSVTGATLTLRTEREVEVSHGKYKRRRRTVEVSTFRIPSPTQPPDELQALYRLLNWSGDGLPGHQTGK